MLARCAKRIHLKGVGGFLLSEPKNASHQGQRQEHGLNHERAQQHLSCLCQPSDADLQFLGHHSPTLRAEFNRCDISYIYFLD